MPKKLKGVAATRADARANRMQATHPSVSASPRRAASPRGSSAGTGGAAGGPRVSPRRSGSAGTGGAASGVRGAGGSHSDQDARLREVKKAKSERSTAKGVLLSFIKEPALAQEKTLTMRSSFQLAAQEIYPNQTPDDAFDSMWAIPFNVKTGRPDHGVAQEALGCPHPAQRPACHAVHGPGQEAGQGDSGAQAQKRREELLALCVPPSVRPLCLQPRISRDL